VATRGFSENRLRESCGARFLPADAAHQCAASAGRKRAPADAAALYPYSFECPESGEKMGKRAGKHRGETRGLKEGPCEVAQDLSGVYIIKYNDQKSREQSLN